MNKRLLLWAFIALAFTACKKEDEDDDDTNPAGCLDTYVCFTLDGVDISGPGGGYFFADTSSFIKYEEGLTQLSIDIRGNNTGVYPVSNVREAGKARIYYFDENNVQYLAKTGMFEVTEFTSSHVVSGTFSGTVEKYVNETFMGETKEITNGSFKKIQLN